MMTESVKGHSMAEAEAIGRGFKAVMTAETPRRT